MEPTNHQLSSSLTCDLKIIRAKNLDFIAPGKLFVRYYLVAGNGEKVRLCSREILATCDPRWNESFSLQCGGAPETVAELRRQKVVFELRWRSTSILVGKIMRSTLLGRGEVSWKDVLESEDMSMVRWVSLDTQKCSLVGLKPPALQLGMGVLRQPAEVQKMKRRVGCSAKWNECGCRDGSCNARDEELFCLVAAANVF
ncbi:hypothetical protein H6P81_011525 [Aristolochia fimbriata]|uniref:C2 domain-containing protein n=1 Tax=Aristolochia fimbriata TaxID=158543 RepID=A0AAV7ERR4_ARIFI|nr:hypothetical protein H6P81_011525 [Aristolochia fimbriata]